jgi:general secretion pathway protein H
MARKVAKVPMPTSVPGISTRIETHARGHDSRGFTLLEIMVVVAIIGIFVGVVVLSTDLVSYERQLEQEARRLDTIVSFASDEALLQTQDFGILICEDSYHFFVYSYDVEDWIPYAAKPFEPRRLDADMSLALKLEDREIVLQTEAQAFDSPMSDQLTEEELDDLPEPQIVILSSGEVTPFQVEFLRRSAELDPGVVLNMAFNGKSELTYDGF